jgi:hypothetical protein
MGFRNLFWEGAAFAMTVSQNGCCRLARRRMVHGALLDLDLDLYQNEIEGEEGGRQVSLLLQRFPAWKVLGLSQNRLGPLGALSLEPGLAPSAGP